MACQINDGEYFAPNGEKSKLYNDLEQKVGKSQAQDLFVLAYTPNFIRDVQSELIYNYKNKFPEIPANLNFKETGSIKNRTFQLIENGSVKGKIQLTSYKQGYKIKSAFVNEEEYGKAIYSYVARQMISENKNLHSDQIRTESADNIWNYFSELGVTDKTKKIIYAKPLNSFDENGEILAENVLEYATSINENTQPLNFVDQQETRIMMAEFPDIEDSDDLADKLTKAFYKNGLFSPTKDTLKSLYSKYETDLILSDINALGKVKESIEKLKRTPKIYNTTVLPAIYKLNDLNIYGKLKNENPYIIKQDIVERYGGVEKTDLSEIKDRTITEEYLSQFKRIPSIYDNGTPIVEEVIYPNSIKIVDDSRIFEAVDTLLNAPEIVDTTKVEQKLSNWLLRYGINIQGFTKDLLPSLKLFIENPSEINTQIFSDKYREIFNIPVKQRERVTKIENKDRDLVYMETTKSEQQLFDEMNLLQTEVANVYHRIEKVDFQEMKESFNLSNDITELQAYKDYFNYNTNPVIKEQTFPPIALTYSLDYLTNDFIADFNIEKIKNPNNGLYNKFKITEKGIEQIYSDPLSMAEIEAHIIDETKLTQPLQEYSVISKQMENLMNDNPQMLTNKFNNRIWAVNNFSKIPVELGDVVKLNSNTTVVKNGINEFINNEDELFELVGKEGSTSIYTKIQKNLNLLYNNTLPLQPVEQIINLQTNLQQQKEYTNIKKQWKSSEIGDSFDCL